MRCRRGSWAVLTVIPHCADTISQPAGLHGHTGWCCWGFLTFEGHKLSEADGSKRHIQISCCPQGCSGGLAENHYNLTSGLFLELAHFSTSQLMRSGKMVTLVLWVDPSGRVFMTLSQGDILVSPTQETHLPESSWAAQGRQRLLYLHLQLPIGTVKLSGGLWGGMFLIPAVTGLLNCC